MLPIVLLIVNLGLVLNIFTLQSSFLGTVFLIGYFLVNGYLGAQLLEKVVEIEGKIVRLFLAIFLIFSSISFLGTIFIIFFKINDIILSIIVLLPSICIYILAKKYKKIEKIRFSINFSHFFQEIRDFYTSIPLSKVPYGIALLLLMGIGLLSFLVFDAPASHIMSPWDVLPNAFLWIVAILSTVILGFVFYGPKKYLIFFIVLFSLFIHLYIPAVYQAPYGLDDWRHVGMMGTIIDEGNIEPLNVSETLVSPKPSYGAFWGASIFLHKTLAVKLTDLAIWWHMLFFSLFVPLLFYAIGKELAQIIRVSSEDAKKVPLFLAFLPFLFYPMQLYGSISLPVGYGFVFFLFFLFIVLQWIRTKKRALLYILLGSTVLMFFSYVIYFLFALLILGFLFVISRTQNFYHSSKQKLFRIIYLIASLAFFPLVSLFASPNARFDLLKTGMDHVKDFWIHVFEYHLGFEAMGSARPQAGNLIWHDMSGQWFFDTFLLILFLLLLGYALERIFSLMHQERKWSTERTVVLSLIVYILVVSIGSILLDYFYFGGIHLLSERMDLIVNTGMILILGTGIWFMPCSKPRTWGLIIFLSLMLASTLGSGPVYGRGTVAHRKATEWIYSDMVELNRTEYCVLSEQFPLAAMEAASRGTIRNGNFTIKYGYLEDNVQIFIKMFSDPQIRWMEQSTLQSNAPGCYLLLDSRFMAPWSRGAINGVLGNHVFNIDDVWVWRYDGS